MKYTFFVRGMSCASCAASIERVIRKMDGVTQVNVNLVLEEVVIETNKEIMFELFEQVVSKAGFILEKKQETMIETYTVEGMHCASCSASVEKILQRFDEIVSADVNLVMNTVTITYTTNRFDVWKQALEKAGFVLRKQTDKQVLLDVTNMTCSSCSASIEKIVKKMQGVKEVSVNLVMQQATIIYDASKIKPTEMIQAIQKAGFGAKIHVDEKQTEEVNIKRPYRMYSTLVVGAILLYIGMSHMLGNIKLPLPNIISYEINPVNFGLIQWILATYILVNGFHFFTRGLKALWHKTPNMDTLVAIGTGSAYIYSMIALVQLIQGNHHAMHSLYFESAGVVVALVQFGKHLESISKKKSTGAIQALLKLRPNTATLYRDGQEISISIDEVQVDDLLVVKPGEHIAVDGVVVEGISNVDESMLSGESMPLKKQVDDAVHQGTMNVDGRLVIRCVNAQEDTMLANIIRMVEEAQGKKAPIARIADKISLYFVPTVIIIALLSAILWYLVTTDMTFALTIFVSVLVIACPCALGLATPTAIMVGTGKAAQMGIFMKSGEALEITSSIDTIVFDKTGTITIGKPVVTDMKTNFDETQLLTYAAMLEQGSKHPLAHAILQKAQALQLTYPSLENIQTDNGRGLYASYDNHEIFVGSVKMMEEHQMDVSAYVSAMKQYQESGKTVVWVAVDRVVYGIIAIADQIKDNVAQVMERLKQQRIQVYMITGDNRITANAIAKIAGIDHVIAEVLPHQKGEEVARLQALGHKVAMDGGGTNDAIALTQSEVGIAIGSGSDVAIESADIVLVKDDIQDVEHALRLSRAVIRNIRQNLFWAFFYNIIGIPLAAGILYPINGMLLSPVFAGAAMAFSSVSVVSNALRLRNFK